MKKSFLQCSAATVHETKYILFLCKFHLGTFLQLSVVSKEYSVMTNIQKAKSAKLYVDRYGF